LTLGTSPCPCRRGRCSSIVNRVVRSTRVRIAELPSPRIKSPSQWPGTARSSASAGRSLSMISGVTNFLPRSRFELVALAVLARSASTRPTRGPTHPGLAHRAPDRSPRARSAWTHHAGNRPRGGSRSALGSTTWPTPVLAATVAPTDPPHLRACHQLAIGSGDRASETILHVLAKLIVQSELRDLGTTHAPLRVPLRRRRPILQPIRTRRPIAAQLPRDRRRRPAQGSGDRSHPPR
jgi:hypothetical protein